MEQSDDDGQKLFNQNFGDQDKKSQSEDNLKNQQNSPKRVKKHHKNKKTKKKLHIQNESDEEDQSDQARNSLMDDYFQDEASQGSEQQDQEDSAEIGYQEQRRRLHQNNIYERKQKDGRQVILERLQGKSQKEINAMFKEKIYQRRENEVLFPSFQDHQTYSVRCAIGKEEEVVYSILKKTEHYKKTNNPKFKIQITSAMAMKKKYPGRIFIEAVDEKAIRQGLQNFIDVNIKKINRLDYEDYTNLFVSRQTDQTQFKEKSYVRIKKGVYENDLGKIVKLKKKYADVILVPRVNVQEILIKIKEWTSKMTDQKAIQQKKQQILKKFINPRTYYPQNMRPAKKFFQSQDPFTQIDVPFASKINIQKGGLIVLNFKLDQLKKIQQGSILPAQMAPFIQNGQSSYEQMKEQKVATIINFQKGQQTEIIAGQLQGLYGTVQQIKQNTVVIKCRVKGLQGMLLEQPIDHFAKKFKQGQRVKVNSGADKGKTGLILKLDGKYADIWTQNENTIKINKNNLQIYLGEVINQQNVHNLKKDDLIKTSKNIIGIVVSTTKDNIKILDMNNTIQIINNLDFDCKINSTFLLIKNKTGEQIRNNSIVRIRQGPHQGLRCLVKHVYKDHAFLFNDQLDQTSGITVEKADNCVVLAKTSEGIKRFSNKFKVKSGFNERENAQDNEFKVGKSIIIPTGPLKGYRGVIKSIVNDKLQIRIPQKGSTEWVSKSGLAWSNRDKMDMGKTPSRMGMSTHQQASMSPNNYRYN